MERPGVAAAESRIAPAGLHRRVLITSALSSSSSKAQAQFLTSAADAAQFPTASQGEQEVAFLGRSNVGKSSLLNRMVDQPDLAFTSSRPGCTQLINFFQVDKTLRFVDLPGYGYARVSLEERASWKTLIESYLLARRNLALSLLLIDGRRGWMEMDLELKAWLEFHNRPFRVVATKVDKWKSNNQRIAGLAAIAKQVPDVPVISFSAVDGRGVRELWQIISKIKTQR